MYFRASELYAVAEEQCRLNISSLRNRGLLTGCSWLLARGCLGFEGALKHIHKLNKAATLLPLLKSWLSARIASTAIGLHASRERRTGFGCETSRGCRRRRLRCTGRASGSRRRRRAAGSRRKLSPLITSDELEMNILISRSDVGLEG